MKCWYLTRKIQLVSNMDVVVSIESLSLPSAMTNVFKIRHNKETHVYRTEVTADKKALLTQFRHVAEELAAKRRREREGEHQRRKSMWMAGDVGNDSVHALLYIHFVPPARFTVLSSRCAPLTRLPGWHGR